MYFDLENLNSREAQAIITIIHSMKCPAPLAICGLCDAVKFCSFLSDLEEGCQEIVKAEEGV